MFARISIRDRMIGIVRLSRDSDYCPDAETSWSEQEAGINRHQSGFARPDRRHVANSTFSPWRSKFIVNIVQHPSTLHLGIERIGFVANRLALLRLQESVGEVFGGIDLNRVWRAPLRFGDWEIVSPT